MHLDVLTLIVAGSFVALVSAAVLTGAWLNMGRMPALRWWAGAMYLYSVGVGCIALGVSSRWSDAIVEGGFLTAASIALIWAGTRVFHRRSPHGLPLAAALLIGSVFVFLLVSTGRDEVSIVAALAVSLILICATEYELWRGRNEALTARWALIALLSLHAVILLGGLHDTFFPSAPLTAGPQLNSWFGLVNFEGLIFAVGAPILMMTLCRERITLDYERASHLDPLTGIANRRALFAKAERLVDRCRADASPLSVIEFDLDRFKTINDTYGHAVGDAALHTFVTATQSVLRPGDLFGRHGGEEFAVVLPGATAASAYAVAERARLAFLVAARRLYGREIHATVSAGVAELGVTESFSDALDAADRALYRAKGRGRNRVERADQLPADQSAIIRIA